MNIVFVSTAFMIKGIISGGLPNYLYRTASFLVKHGNNVIILYLSNQNSVKRKKGIKLVSVRIQNAQSNKGKSFENNYYLSSYIIK